MENTENLDSKMNFENDDEEIATKGETEVEEDRKSKTTEGKVREM